jgi:hypothetical protein
MSKKKNAPKASAPDLPALRIGSRVRCTDDGVEGRIVWANAVSVKIRWDDGEQVTWRRDSLAGRPIQILDAGDGNETPPPAEPAAAEETATAEPTPAEADTTAPTPEPQALEQQLQGNALANSNEASWDYDRLPDRGNDDGSVRPEEDATESVPAPEATADQSGDGTAAEPAQPARTPKRQRKATTEAKEKKPSCLDAAAKVLAEAGQALSCQEMIDAMAAKGYWTSPGGKTPASTLYSAILRELSKGAASRFVKTERGKFSRQG